MSLRNQDKKNKKDLLTNNAKAVKTALKSMVGIQKEIEDDNEKVINEVVMRLYR